MKFPGFLWNSWFWLLIAIFGFSLCTFLPLLIKDEKLRQRINWLILIPASLIIIFYVYPVGIEVFRKLALSF